MLMAIVLSTQQRKAEAACVQVLLLGYFKRRSAIPGPAGEWLGPYGVVARHQPRTLQRAVPFVWREYRFDLSQNGFWEGGICQLPRCFGGF